MSDFIHNNLKQFVALKQMPGFTDIEHASGIITQLQSDLAAANAIVEKLPRTKDGVVIFIGDFVYSPYGKKQRVLIDALGGFAKDHIYYVAESHNVDGEWRDILASECYSTSEAAHAARDGGK